MASKHSGDGPTPRPDVADELTGVNHTDEDSPAAETAGSDRFVCGCPDAEPATSTEPPIGRGATIYDVAQAAGVSPSTVSRAFSRPGRVSDATAARIHQVAEHLGYRSNHVFRPAMPNRTKLIGILVTDLTNPFTFGIIRGAQHAAAERGYSVTLLDSQESVETEREIVGRTLPSLDGLVVASARASDTALRGYGKRVPTVVLNRVVGGLPCLIPDNPRGMRRAVEHLADLGHRRIAYVAGPDASWANGARLRAFREACFELGLSERKVGPVDPTVRGGASALPDIASIRASAVICYNDMVAIGVMRAVVAAGRHVPRDLAVVGFDNTFASELVTPGLTTVASPFMQLGERATIDVVAMIARGSQVVPTEPVVMPMKLIVRRSSVPSDAATSRL